MDREVHYLIREFQDIYEVVNGTDKDMLPRINLTFRQVR